jgi:hypothetical protein
MSKSCRRCPNVMTKTALQKTVVSRESAELRGKCAQFYFGAAYDANPVGDSSRHNHELLNHLKPRKKPSNHLIVHIPRRGNNLQLV